MVIKVKRPRGCYDCPFGLATGLSKWTCGVLDMLEPINPYENDKHNIPNYCPMEEEDGRQKRL